MTVEVERTERKPVEMRSPGAHAAPEVRRTEVAPPAAEGTAIGDRGGPESIGAAPARFRRIAWRASGVLALATAAAAASGWRLAEPLAIGLALGVVVAIAAGIGRGRGRARDGGDARTGGDAARAATLRAALRIGAIVVLASGVIVALSLEWRLAAAGMAMTVAILSIVGAPVWLAIVSDERERATREASATEPPAPPDRARGARAPRGG